MPAWTTAIVGTGAPQGAHDRVADALRARIQSGDLLPGDSLPTQKALMEEFGVERGVVRRAIDLLKCEHLLSDAGRGVPPTVAGPRTDPDSRDEHDAAFVEHSRMWFESLWTSIAVPYPIGC